MGLNAGDIASVQVFCAGILTLLIVLHIVLVDMNVGLTQYSLPVKSCHMFALTALH